MRAARLHPLLWSLLISIGPVLLLVLKLVPELDQAKFHNALGHVLISADASLLGAALAVLMLRVAHRAQDGRIFMVGMGFLTTTSMLIAHYRLSTPAMLQAGRDFVSLWPPLLSLGVGGVFFAISGLNLSAQANRRLMRHAGIGLMVYLVIWLFYNWLFLTWMPSLPSGTTPLATPNARVTAFELLPGQAHGTLLVDTRLNTLMPADGITALDTLYLALGIGGLACYSFAAGRHYRLYRRSPSPTSLALTCGIVLFGEALLTQLLARYYAPSFWLYHIELAAGFSVIGYAMLRAYHHGQSDESLLERLFLAATRVRLQSSSARAMEELVATFVRAERPTVELREILQQRFALTESQVQVLEQAADAIGQERRQRQELQQLNAMLHQLEQDKDVFTQMLVHDLKNSLAAQISCLDLIRREPLTENQGLLLESALRSSKNLSDVVANLLDISRLEEGRFELERSLVPPHDLLDACAEELRGWIAEDYKTLQVVAAADLPLLHVDLRLIRRVLLNLLSNAIKHTPGGTDILLRAFATSSPPAEGAHAPAPRVIIEVTDTGPGIPAQDLERIFERYARIAGCAEGRYDSSGLGLTFCRLAIEAHGGVISVTSQVGVGTTFRLELPAR